MKSTPILMDQTSIQAYMAGCKTQTRRVVKPQPDEDGLAFNLVEKVWMDTSGRAYKCPYGQPGDELWFKEIWKPADIWVNGYVKEEPTHIAYRADNSVRDHDYDGGWKVDVSGANFKHVFWTKGWKSQRYMFKWAARHRPKITSVRVERVQDISAADAMAEGIGHLYGYTGKKPAADAVARFAERWDSINGKKQGESWPGNPYNWVIEFERYKICGEN